MVIMVPHITSVGALGSVGAYIRRKGDEGMCKVRRTTLRFPTFLAIFDEPKKVNNPS